MNQGMQINSMKKKIQVNKANEIKRKSERTGRVQTNEIVDNEGEQVEYKLMKSNGTKDAYKSP
jgi:hypothetical protein